MKKISIIFSVGVAAMMGMSSCKKDMTEINKTNPNQFSDSDPTLMITGAELANVILNEGEAARLAGIFAGHFNGYDRQFISYAQYNMTSGDFNTPWGNLYTEGIAQCRLIEAKAAKANNQSLLGVAMINEAQLLLAASGLWGDIPDKEACNDAISNPKFDKMSDVTKHCIALLDSAANLTSGTDYSAAFAGSFDWVEVANTLKARAYLRMGDYASALASAKKGVSAGADMYANHSTESPGAWNLYYDFLDWNRGGYISCDGAPIVGMLDTASKSSKNNPKTDETARFDYYFLADNYTPLDPNMYTGIFAPTSNFAMVSYVENELIMAECYARGGDNANALFHLNNVRKEHEANYGGYQDYVLSDFGPTAMVKGLTESAALGREIMVEKYVSLFGQLEPFCDLRRTKNAIGIKPYAGTSLPGCFMVPQDEINANTNAPTGGSLFDVLELFK